MATTLNQVFGAPSKKGQYQTKPLNSAGLTLAGGKNVAQGYAIAYGPDGKPRGLVKIGQGIAPGYGIRYDANGQPSLMRVGKTPGVGDVAYNAPRLGAAVSPSAPASTQAAPRNLLAPDALYSQEVGSQNRQYGTSLAGIQQDEDASALDYGINVKRGADITAPDGTVYKGEVTGYDDPFSNPAQLASNPFSRAAALQKSYQTNQKVTSAGFAARGHLYGGGQIAQQGENTTQFEGGKNSMLTAFQNLIGNWRQSRTTAADALQTANIGSLGTLRDRNAAIDVPDQPGAAAVAPTKDWTDGKPFTNSKGTRGFYRVHADGRRVFIKVK